MNRFRNPLRLAVAAAVAVAIMGAPSRAEAGFAIRVSTDGGATFGAAIVDGDNDGFISVGLGAFTITGTGFSFTNPDLSLLDVAISGIAAPGSYDFVVQATLTDVVTVPAPQPFNMVFTGNSLPSGGTYAARTWVDDNNGLFATTGGGILVDSGFLSPGQTYHTDFMGNVPYSVTTQVATKFTVGAGPAQSIYYDSNNSISAAPAPAGLLLLASAVPALGFGSWLRRRRATAPVAA